MTSISKRVQVALANPSPIVVGHTKCAQNPYSNDNPQGHLNFGIAQNHLMENETVDFVNHHNYFAHSDIHYNPGHGKASLKQAFAQFAKNFLNISDMNPDFITVQTGVSSLCESLSFCLFDEGETLLMPAPYYSGFIYDFTIRFKVNVETVELKKENDFKHNLDDFIQRIKETNPKAILLTHPYNPTGESLSENFYAPLVDYCQKQNIHIISDEIYALSRLDGSTHHSLLSYDYENIHFLYGLAKDFTLAGLKMGFFYTRNKELSQAMQSVSYFHTTSTQTQNTVELLFKDEAFIQNYIQLNQKRLEASYQRLREALPQLQHIKPDAGVFFFANFSHLLKDQSQSSEMELFTYFIDELKINITPGTAMGMKDYGWFRVCYAKEESHLAEFIKRMQTKVFAATKA